MGYNIGLDIGTNGVGWAVTDEKGHLKKINGKDFWGVNLFNAAEHAKDRRVFRSQRRRYGRRKERIRLLQLLLYNEMEKVDPQFFLKMQQSFLHLEDKEIHNEHFSKFLDNQSINKIYPTIYHLRKELIENDEKKDFRLVYLALHHILKNRGNFLYQDQSMGDSLGDVNENFEYVLNFLKEYDVLELDLEDFQNILNEELIKNESRARIRETIQNSLVSRTSNEYNNLFKQLIGGMLGYEMNLGTIFGNILAKVKMDKEIADSDLEEIPGEYHEFIYEIQKIYHWKLLNQIMYQQQFISDAMIYHYDLHQQTLREVKDVLKNHSREKYKEYFRDTSKHGYAGYIDGESNINYEEFKKYSKKFFSELEVSGVGEEKIKGFLSLINDDEFLRKIRSSHNAAIPYQLHRSELVRIIENQSRYYPVLQEEKDKIISLLEFRIPYYVGPLNPKSQFAWIERENQKIYPWNFDEVVDKDSSSEKFIKRMLNKGSYLYEENVIPRHSLLYNEYTVWNELNKIRVNGHKLDSELLYDIFECLFKKKKTVSKKDLVEFLESKHLKVQDITGFQKEDKFASNLDSFIDFSKILGDIGEDNTPMIESIIEWITLFEEKDILKKRIEKFYGELITKEQIQQLANLKYKGWSRLSRKLLTGIFSKNTQKSIIEILRETSKNFMEIINNARYDFASQIEELNKKDHSQSTINYDLVEDLQASPEVKRGVWQSLKIVAEIKKILGEDPQEIYIETTREPREKKRTSSRKKIIEDKYSAIKAQVNDYNNLITELNENEKRLSSKRVFLYFLQEGRCLYTNERLDIERLEDYEVDHILPQSLIKNDSLDNSALVVKRANQRKAGSLVVPEEYRRNMKAHWISLKNKNLISTTKYNYLVREEFSEAEVTGFIKRQLVETSQMNKHVSSIFKEVFPNSEIHNVRAKVTTDLRDKLQLFKIRDFNVVHHAHDALFAAVLGRFSKMKFPWIFDTAIRLTHMKFYKEIAENNERKAVNLHEARRHHGFIITEFLTDDPHDDFPWNSQEEIKRLKRAYLSKNYFIRRKPYISKSKLFNQTIYPNDHPKATIPLKKGLDPKKYGGYSGLEKAYYSIIEYKKKKKVVKEFFEVNVANHLLIQSNQTTLWQLVRDYLGHTEFKILREKVYKNQLMMYDGTAILFVSPNEFKLAGQMMLPDHSHYLKRICNENAYFRATEGEELHPNDADAIFISDFYDKLGNFFKPLQEQIISKIGLSPEETKEVFIKNFIDLDQSKQCEALKLLFAILSGTRKNISEFWPELKSETGRFSKKIDLRKVTIIDQSITGVFAKESKF